MLYDVETGELSSVLETTYTADGEPLLEEMRDEDGNLMFSFEYRYDVPGKDYVFKSALYLSGVELLASENGYVLGARGSYGNWTEKLEYEWEEKFGEEQWVLRGVTRRQIEYYE